MADEPSPFAIAALLMNVAPAVTRAMRAAARRRIGKGLSVAQIRSLALAGFRPSVSLTDLARHLGLTLPAASRLVDGLAERGLIKRDISRDDRRRIMLTLSETGTEILNEAADASRRSLAAMLDPLDDSERATLFAMLQRIQPMFVNSRG